MSKVQIGVVLTECQCSCTQRHTVRHQISEHPLCFITVSATQSY